MRQGRIYHPIDYSAQSDSDIVGGPPTGLCQDRSSSIEGVERFLSFSTAVGFVVIDETAIVV